MGRYTVGKMTKLEICVSIQINLITMLRGEKAINGMIPLYKAKPYTMISHIIYKC